MRYDPSAAATLRWRSGEKAGWYWQIREESYVSAAVRGTVGCVNHHNQHQPSHPASSCAGYVQATIYDALLGGQLVDLAGIFLSGKSVYGTEDSTFCGHHQYHFPLGRQQSISSRRSAFPALHWDASAALVTCLAVGVWGRFE